MPNDLAGMRTRIDALGRLHLTMPSGADYVAGHVVGLDGYTPKKGRDYEDGARGPAGKDGLDGRDGKDGADGRDGVGADGGRGERGEQGIAGKDGARGFAGSDGKDGADGLPGRDGVDGLPGVSGLPGKDGAPGALGEIPRHEWEGTKVRFELLRSPTGKTVKWGPWVDLQGRPGRKQGYGGWERTDLLQRVLAVINPNPMDGYAIADEDVSDANVKYAGYTKVGKPQWYVIKIDHSALATVPYTYATSSNNGSIATFTAAWAARATLTYSAPSAITIT